MAITKEKKKELVKEADSILKDAKSVVFVTYKGMKVVDTTMMRKDLKKASVSYRVMKKTLLKRALEAANVAGTLPEIKDEVAIAYGEDLIAPAREVFVYQKKFKDNLGIIGGVFEGKYMNKEEMLSIATIPGMQVLRGQFVNLINSPIQGLVLALNAIAEKKA